MSKGEPEISRVTRSKEEAKASYNIMSKWYDMTPLKKGHFHRQDAKGAKIFKQERKNVHLYKLVYKED